MVIIPARLISIPYRISDSHTPHCRSENRGIYGRPIVNNCDETHETRRFRGSRGHVRGFRLCAQCRRFSDAWKCAKPQNRHKTPQRVTVGQVALNAALVPGSRASFAHRQPIDRQPTSPAHFNHGQPFQISTDRLSVRHCLVC